MESRKTAAVIKVLKAMNFTDGLSCSVGFTEMQFRSAGLCSKIKADKKIKHGF